MIMQPIIFPNHKDFRFLFTLNLLYINKAKKSINITIAAIETNVRIRSNSKPIKSNLFIIVYPEPNDKKFNDIIPIKNPVFYLSYI